jgi:hypothetical protein
VPRAGALHEADDPRRGHALNLEEPQLFNQLVADFLRTVELGRWS